MQARLRPLQLDVEMVGDGKASARVRAGNCVCAWRAHQPVAHDESPPLMGIRYPHPVAAQGWIAGAIACDPPRDETCFLEKQQWLL